MNEVITEYEASWRKGVRFDLRPDANPQWSLTSFTDIVSNKIPIPNDRLKDAVAGIRASVSGIVGAMFAPMGRAMPAEGHLLRLVSKEVDTAPLLSEEALWLNNIVSLGTLQKGSSTATLVRNNIVVEIDIPHSGKRWFYSHSKEDRFWYEHLYEYVLVFRDLFTKRVSTEDWTLSPWDPDEARRALDILDSHRVKYDYAVHEYKVDLNSITLGLQVRATLVPYPRGALCGSLPIPGKSRSDGAPQTRDIDLVDGPEVVVTSPNVVETLTQLSRLWQDRFAQSVLLSAPPGSGKEAFAVSIGPGAGRDPRALKEISLAIGDQADLEKRLYGVSRADGSVSAGLIAAAEGSVLFLDEAHYPLEGTGIRASLLRPLESKEYVPFGSTEARKFEDVLFVFASSLPLRGKSLADLKPKDVWARNTNLRTRTPSALSDLEPKDFWTRMTHVLQIKHPLDFEDHGIDTKQGALESLIKFFWWDRAERYFHRRLRLVDVRPEYASAKGEAEDPSVLLSRRQINILFARNKLDSAARVVSASLLEELGADRLSSVSVRGIRTIVSRAFAVAAYSVSRGDTDWVNNPDFADSVQGAVKEILQIAGL